MTRTSSAATLTLLFVLATASAAWARHSTSAPPRGTNSAGTAQSSGGRTTGSAAPGSGRERTGATTSPDAAINAENNLLDRKLKGICRGC